MQETPLHFKTISEVASLIETKQISPVELTEAMLGRIDSLDGRYKSYATVMADQAMASARGYNPEFQIPLNPWNTERWSGASSSGSGVATAAGMCFGSLGSDTGGSIRFPAAACGIVGSKPTWGRVSRYGVLALAESMDHIGPMTRSSIDAGIMLQVLAGYDANDPTSLTVPAPNILDGLDGGIQGVRIGLDERYITEGVDTPVTAGVLAGVRVLEGLGAQVVQVRMPDTQEFLSAWGVLCQAEKRRPPTGRRTRPAAMSTGLGSGDGWNGEPPSRAWTTPRPTSSG